MCVDINEHKFEGTGKTKKDARMMAAEKAIEFLIQHPEYIQKPAPAANTNAESVGSVDEKLGKVFEAPSDDEDECAEEQDADEDDEGEDIQEGGKRVKIAHDADDESNQNVYSNKIVNNHVTSHVDSNENGQNERTDETIESKDNPEIKQQLFNFS